MKKNVQQQHFHKDYDMNVVHLQVNIKKLKKKHNVLISTVKDNRIYIIFLQENL